MTLSLPASVSETLFRPKPPCGNRLRQFVAAGMDAFGDLLYPPHCASCGAALPPGINKALCLPCAQQIRWIGADRCRRCGAGTGLGSGVAEDCAECRTHPPAHIHSTCSAAHYASGPLRDLILILKFGRKPHVARVLGALLASRIRETQLAGPKTVLAPVPVTRGTALERGFNQTAEIAERAGELLGLPVETRLLQKIRATPPQAVLTHAERRENLKGAFAVQPRIAARFQACRVVLIDDVITTCATVSECARALQGAGLGEIRAASVAR